MAKKFIPKSAGFHPFGELIGLNFSKCENGYSKCELEVREKLLNPHKMLHGGIIYSMVDTGMGGALYSILNAKELCATIEVKINYFIPVSVGTIVCETKVIHKSKKIAALESEVKSGEHLVAKAMGTFSIFNVKAK